MRSRVYVTVGRLSVCLCAGGFAAVGPATGDIDCCTVHISKADSVTLSVSVVG